MSGDISNIKIEGISSQKAQLLLEEGKLYLNIEGVRDSGIVYWTGANSTTWNYADAENFQNIEGENDIFVSGDKVIFDDAANKFTVSLTGELDPDTVIVDNTKAYTFSGTGAITGNASLVKRGTGTLTISNDNTYTGLTLISGGTVKVSALSNDTKAYGNLGAVNTSNQKFIIENGATLQTTAAVETSTPIRVRTEEGGVINNSANFTANKNIVGTLLTKKGVGTLLCFTTNSSLTKMVVVAGGVAERSGNAANTIELQGGTLWDDSQSTTHAINVPKGKSATWQLSTAYYTNYTNKLTGEGTLTVVPRNKVNRVRISGDWSQFRGTVKHTTTDIWLPFDCTSGMPHGTLDIAANCGVTNVAKAMTIGAVTGSGSLNHPISNFQNKSGVSGNNTWNIGNSDDNNFTFAGTIHDEGGSNKSLFNKVGTCKMTFTGKGDFSGACRVNGGELCLNSSKTDIMLGTSTLNVAKGATLSGKGTLGNSSVTVATGGTIRSGITETNAGGNLKFSDKNLTVNGTIQTYISTKSTFSKFTGIGKLTLNGTLAVRGKEGLELAVGDELMIFDASEIVLGSNVVFDLCEPNKAMGYTWDTSRLNEGILVVGPAPDGIMSLKSDALRDEEIFTLQGVRLQNRPTRAGIYVVDGRKMLLK